MLRLNYLKDKFIAYVYKLMIGTYDNQIRHHKYLSSIWAEHESGGVFRNRGSLFFKLIARITLLCNGEYSNDRTCG